MMPALRVDRRGKPTTQRCRVPIGEKVSIKDYTIEELMAEIARRGQAGEIEQFEDATVNLAERLKEESFSHWAASVSDPDPEAGKPAPKAACPRCGRPVGVKQYRVARTLTTRGGRVTIYRNYHYCGKCAEGFYPKDGELGLDPGAEASPGIERLCLDFAVNDPYEKSVERLELHHGLVVSEKQLKGIVARRGDAWLSSASGSPAPRQRPEPLAVMLDGSMQPGREGWKEGKLACLETLGFPSERHYLGTTSGLAEFEARLKRGLKQARAFEREVIWIADGAEWIWKLQERLAPEAFCLLDWFHLAEHVGACADALLGEGSADAAIFRRRACDLLWANRVDDFLAELEACRFLCGRGAAGAERRKALTELQGYIANHGRFMDYPTARARGYPVGSGAVESAHRGVWHVRLKRPGARWSSEGLERMAQLRLLYANVGAMEFYRELREAA
jgi:hypothetical protein